MIKCGLGSYRHYENGNTGCRHCVDHCAECSNDETCEACMPGYIFADGNHKECNLNPQQVALNAITEALMKKHETACNGPILVDLDAKSSLSVSGCSSGIFSIRLDDQKNVFYLFVLIECVHLLMQCNQA